MKKDKIITFEQIPYAVSLILDQLETMNERLALVQATANTPLTIPAKKILTSVDICNLLDMKKSTVYNLTHCKKIPHFKTNGRVSFDADEIDRWIHSDRRKTIKQLQDEANNQLRK